MTISTIHELQLTAAQIYNDKYKTCFKNNRKVSSKIEGNVTYWRVQ